MTLWVSAAPGPCREGARARETAPHPALCLRVSRAHRLCTERLATRIHTAAVTQWPGTWGHTHHSCVIRVCSSGRRKCPWKR